MAPNEQDPVNLKVHETGVLNVGDIKQQVIEEVNNNTVNNVQHQHVTNIYHVAAGSPAGSGPTHTVHQGSLGVNQLKEEAYRSLRNATDARRACSFFTWVIMEKGFKAIQTLLNEELWGLIFLPIEEVTNQQEARLTVDVPPPSGATVVFLEGAKRLAWTTVIFALPSDYYREVFDLVASGRKLNSFNEHDSPEGYMLDLRNILKKEEIVFKSYGNETTETACSQNKGRLYTKKQKSHKKTGRAASHSGSCQSLSALWNTVRCASA